MEKEADILRAKATMRDLLSRRGVKRGVRIHQQAAEDTLQRLRSLEGICGNCQNMQLEFFRADDKDMVEVHCCKGHRPHRLYGDTPFGQKPDCPDFAPGE